jgi:hypothetical protein
MNLIGQRRRPEPRWFESTSGRTGRFDAVATSGGKSIAVVGTRLAREGVAFVSGVALRDGEIPLSFTIRRRTIPSRVRVMRHEPFREAARLVHRYYCSFTVLDDADREIVGRYVDGVPEPSDPPAPPQDARGGISGIAQARIAEQLVKMKRLAPAAPGLAPLIRLEAEPARTLEDGREVRCFAVHSRLRAADGVRTFVTRFRVFDDDRVDVVS